MTKNLLITGLLAATAGVAQATTIFEDTFEANTMRYLDVMPAGWSVYNNIYPVMDVLDDTQYEGNLCGGSGVCIDLDAGGGMKHALEITAAGDYVLSFDIAGNRRSQLDSIGGQSEPFVAQVLSGSTVVASLSGLATGFAAGSAYTTVTLNFNVAAAGTYAITFQGTGGDARYGALLDNVSVATAPVPEPETYAMLLSGLCLLGFVARRRSRA